MNIVYFVNSLGVLKDLYHYNPDGFNDLVYINPPFKLLIPNKIHFLNIHCPF